MWKNRLTGLGHLFYAGVDDGDVDCAVAGVGLAWGRRALSTKEDWRAAKELEGDALRLAQTLATHPAAQFAAVLPVPPGINQWWEPYTVPNRRGRRVASLRLTGDATKYRARAERVLLDAGVDVIALEDDFHDLWLQIEITTYLATPLERDADGPLKPLQDVLCGLLGVDDARVRRTAGRVLLDPAEPRVLVRVAGFQVWDSSGEGGPFYMVRTHLTADGPRTEPLLLTPRRLPTPRSLAQG
jgi:hypothetical protein